MESTGALNPLGDFNLVNEVNVIEQDIEDVNDKCNKIQCTPIYNTLNAVIKLIIDIFKYFKFKAN
jgi:hypothetical protein